MPGTKVDIFAQINIFHAYFIGETIEAQRSILATFAPLTFFSSKSHVDIKFLYRPRYI